MEDFEEDVLDMEDCEADVVADVGEDSEDPNADKDDDKMSDYFKTLVGDVRMRYKDKIAIINNIDPYTLDAESPYKSKSSFPIVSYMDVVSYFLCTHSFFTAEKLKSYKSLESYKFCEAGYVRDVCVYKIDEHFVVRAKVQSAFFFMPNFLSSSLSIFFTGKTLAKSSI